jgi:hypothetical protein
MDEFMPPEENEYGRWIKRSARTWTFEDERGVRQIAKLDSYFPVRYGVTGPGYKGSEHPTSEEARAEAEASLG